MKISKMIPTKPGKQTLKCLVILSGNSSTGKSGVLRMLGDLLREESLYWFKQKGRVESHDMRMSCRFNRLTIGIGTAGDSEEIAKQNLAFFNEQKCVVGILAANVNAGVDAWIRTHSKLAPYQIAVIEKKDVQSKFAREAIQILYVDAIYRSFLKSGSIRTIVKSVKTETRGV